jgi:hypothetical protein
VRLHRFTLAGLRRFQEFLRAAAAGDVTAVPADLVTGPGLAAELPGGVDLDPRLVGPTRLTAARHLDAALSAAGLGEPERDAPLWAWLSAACFDAVCPRDRRGRYRPGAASSYIPLIGESRRIYRHRLLGPWLVYRAHRDDPARALCLLAQPLSRPGQLVERFASRPRLVACPAAVGVATLLYVGRQGAIRHGAAASVERLSDVLMQLDRTYDIYGMTTEALLKLLPREFDEFRQRARAPTLAFGSAGPAPGTGIRGSRRPDR